ncbi:MAG: ATP-binding protein [Bacteroidota bacterium]
MAEQSYIPITEADLAQIKQVVGSLLQEVKWTDVAKAAQAVSNADDIGTSILARRKVFGGTGSIGQASLSLIGIGKNLSNNTNLLNEEANAVLNAIQNGLALGTYVAKQFRKSSGLLKIEAKDEDTLSEDEKDELEEKKITQARVLLHVSANYIVWKLDQYKTDDIAALVMSLNENPAISLNGSVNAMNSSTYFFAKFCKESGKVSTTKSFVKSALIYYERIMDIIDSEIEVSQYTEFFTTKKYKYDKTDFVIEGFERATFGSHSEIEVKDISMKDIVANSEGRKSNMRQIDRLLCYDVELKKNPWMELGGLPGFTMKYGPPGTGKSMLIAASFNYGKERADNIGVPFVMLPLPRTVISSLQGETAKKMEVFDRRLKNPNVITYSPWDDCENLLGDRARQGSSEGQGHVVSSVLTMTEGATAVNNGNYFIQIFTNLPDVLDAAILSRVQSRVLLGGPKTYEDFLALDYLWWKTHEEQVPGILGKKLPERKEYEDSMDIPEYLAEIKFDESIIRPEVQEIIAKTDKKYDKSNDPRWFAMFQDLMSDKFDYWTAREDRNVHSAVDFILMDFDIPTDFFNERKHFFEKSYEDRLGILTEMKRERAKKVDLFKIWYQEMIKQASSLISIKNAEIDRKIKEQTNQYIVNRKAILNAEEKEPSLFQ